jgi:hypothetical protein
MKVYTDSCYTFCVSVCCGSNDAFGYLLTNPEGRASAFRLSAGYLDVDRLASQYATNRPNIMEVRNEDCRNALGGLEHLPREIRDSVYDELWKATPGVRVPHHWIDVRLSYGRHGWWEKHDGLPAWLLTSKTVMKEGIEQLLFNSSWTWPQPSGIKEDWNEKASPVLLPIQAEELKLNFKASDVGGHISFYKYWDLGELEHWMVWLADMIKKCPSIKRWHICISLDMHCVTQKPYTFFELLELEGLAQELVVDVAFAADANAAFRPRLDAEITHLGCHIVGGVATGFEIISSTFADEANVHWHSHPGEEMVPREAWRYTFVRKEQEPVGNLVDDGEAASNV